MSLDDQRGYLKRHPKSKRRLTGGKAKGLSVKDKKKQEQIIEKQKIKEANKLLTNVKDFGFDLTHDTRAQWEKIKKLYKKHKGQLYYVSIDLHNEIYVDSLSFMVLPTKAHVDAFEFLEEYKPALVDKKLLQKIKTGVREEIKLQREEERQARW